MACEGLVGQDLQHGRDAERSDETLLPGQHDLRQILRDGEHGRGESVPETKDQSGGVSTSVEVRRADIWGSPVCDPREENVGRVRRSWTRHGELDQKSDEDAEGDEAGRKKEAGQGSVSAAVPPGTIRPV